MTSTAPRLAVAAGLAVTVAATFTAALPAGAAPTAGTTSGGHHWAPPAKASIHPGVKVSMADVDCVAGFVLADRRRVFLAVPAPCSGTNDGQPIDGCSAGQVPFGLPVTIQGARYDGKLVYSSFTQMQLHGEKRPDRCAYNSLSLVKLDRRDVKRTNPSLPVLGGPTKVAKSATAFPDQLTVLLGGAAADAQATATSANGWSHGLVINGHADAASVGSPVVDDTGEAVGMVTFVPFEGTAGESVVTDLRRELRRVRHTPGFAHVHLVKGTEDYKPAGLPTPAP